MHAQVPEADGIVHVRRQLNTHRAVALLERSGATYLLSPVALAAHPDFPAVLDRFGMELLPSGAATRLNLPSHAAVQDVGRRTVLPHPAAPHAALRGGVKSLVA